MISLNYPKRNITLTNKNLLMSKKDLTTLVKSLGFKSLQGFRSYMLSRAKLNEYGCVCYTEKRDNLELNYSDNCKNKFGIAGYVNGMFTDERFN